MTSIVLSNDKPTPIRERIPFLDEPIPVRPRLDERSLAVAAEDMFHKSLVPLPAVYLGDDKSVTRMVLRRDIRNNIVGALIYVTKGSREGDTFELVLRRSK